MHSGKPHEFEALYLMGAVDRGLGNYADAEIMLEQAVQLDPKHYDVRYNLGFVLAKLGKLAAALENLEKALQINPDSSEARFQLQAYCARWASETRHVKSLKLFEQKKQESRQETVARTKADQANQYLQAGDARRAVELYLEAIVEDPKNARTQYDLALALDRLGDYRGERDALLRAVGLDDDFAAPHNQLGFLSLQTGQIADAEKHLKQRFLWIRNMQKPRTIWCALRPARREPSSEAAVPSGSRKQSSIWTSVRESRPDSSERITLLGSRTGATKRSANRA